MGKNVKAVTKKDTVFVAVQESPSSPPVKVTSYGRLFDIGLVSLFVLSKAVLAYKGRSIIPTNLELSILLGRGYDPIARYAGRS